MTREEKEELNALLDRVSIGGRAPEDVRDWIFKALDMTLYKVDVKRLDADIKNLGLVSVLQLVAYGLKGLPLSFRRKKYCSEQFDDPEFFSLEDDEWEKCKLHPDKGIEPEMMKYLIPDE